MRIGDGVTAMAASPSCRQRFELGRGTGVPPVGLEWHGRPAHALAALPPSPSLRRTSRAVHGRDAHATSAGVNSETHLTAIPRNTRPLQ